MTTLVIYDSTGQIFSSPMTGAYIKPQGQLSFLEVEIPNNKILTGVDVTVTPNVAVLEDIPKTELQLAQEQILATQAQLAELQEQVLLK